MFVRRSTYRDLMGRHQRALEELADTREELADWKGSAIRVAGRNTALTEQLEAAREARTVPLDILEERRLRQLAEQARRSLDEQCRTLQRANEAMAAELRDLREGATA